MIILKFVNFTILKKGVLTRTALSLILINEGLALLAPMARREEMPE